MLEGWLTSPGPAVLVHWSHCMCSGFCGTPFRRHAAAAAAAALNLRVRCLAAPPEGPDLHGICCACVSLRMQPQGSPRGLPAHVADSRLRIAGRFAPGSPNLAAGVLCKGLAARNPALQAMSSGRAPGWSPGDVEWDSQELRVAEKRKRRRFTHGGCQVEGCPVPLELPYHRVSSLQAPPSTVPALASRRRPPNPTQPSLLLPPARPALVRPQKYPVSGDGARSWRRRGPSGPERASSGGRGLPPPDAPG